MRVWMDFSASAHPIVLRPVVERLRSRGHEVEMTARDYAQTLDICRIQGLDAVQIGEHGGAGRLGKLRSLASRTRAMKRFGAGATSTWRSVMDPTTSPWQRARSGSRR